MEKLLVKFVFIVFLVVVCGKFLLYEKKKINVFYVFLYNNILVLVL